MRALKIVLAALAFWGGPWLIGSLAWRAWNDPFLAFAAGVTCVFFGITVGVYLERPAVSTKAVGS